jgi:hypothetical protein
MKCSGNSNRLFGLTPDFLGKGGLVGQSRLNGTFRSQQVASSPFVAFVTFCSKPVFLCLPHPAYKTTARSIQV